MKIINQVASLATFTLESLDMVREEALRVDVPWIEEYGDHQSGGWWTVSLFNGSGVPTDVQIRDGTCVPTSLLQSMPRTRELIEGLGLKVMWVRLARLSANSFLWEHVDYGELEPVDRHRLHIPLITNQSARFVIMGRSMNLTVGNLWRLESINPHGVCNLYGPDRIHIVIDCYEDAVLRRLIEQKQLSNENALCLPSVVDSLLLQVVRDAGKLLDLGFTRAAEFHLLRLFFEYSMPVGMPYDLIVDLYAARRLDEAALSWKNRKEVMLGGYQ
jgi:hypothetical protein